MGQFPVVIQHAGSGVLLVCIGDQQRQCGCLKHTKIDSIRIVGKGRSFIALILVLGLLVFNGKGCTAPGIIQQLIFSGKIIDTGLLSLFHGKQQDGYIISFYLIKGVQQRSVHG